ncbi:Uncharacterised protein [Vibrio cholerae]|nr:Uncharacterised protein [Vibrio cholerae]
MIPYLAIVLFVLLPKSLFLQRNLRRSLLLVLQLRHPAYCK